jgi:hypothetical protein
MWIKKLFTLPTTYYGLYTSLMPLLGSALLAGYTYQYVYYFDKHDLGQILTMAFFSIFLLVLSWVHASVLSLIWGFIWGYSALPYLLSIYFVAIAIQLNVIPFIDKERLSKLGIEAIPMRWRHLVLDKLGLGTVVLIRFLPILPFNTTTLLFSVLGISRSKIYMGSLLGILPRVIFLVSTATGAGALIDLFKTY